jgi:hypothetical protein
MNELKAENEFSSFQEANGELLSGVNPIPISPAEKIHFFVPNLGLMI